MGGRRCDPRGGVWWKSKVEHQTERERSVEQAPGTEGELADSSGTPALWSFGVGGGQPVRILSGCCRENDLRINRAGRRLAFAAGADRGEIRLLKDY